jgi:hypothetical protein
VGGVIVENHMNRLVGRNLSRQANPALLYIPGVTGAGREVWSSARSVGPVFEMQVMRPSPSFGLATSCEPRAKSLDRSNVVEI